MKPTQGLSMGNRYRLVRRIAVGGMGEVWVATDTALGREVAVKVLREEFAGNVDFLQRLRTEARNNARLSHPGIAQMYDYGEQEGSGYLVMELVIGEPMSDLLEREPVLPAHRLVPILTKAARGLAAAHEAGVVHRDVKPGNILLSRTGGVKLTDFGVSLASNQVPMTATGMVMGTAQYLSPEQAIGKPATPASDVYALGIVAYESLVGRRPFTGPTPVDIAVAHVNQPVPALPASVDKELGALVLSMLAKDPMRRPAGAAGLADTLEEIGLRVARSRRSAGPRATETVAPPSELRAWPPRSAAPRAASRTPAADDDAPRAYPSRRVVQSRAAERSAARPAGRHREHVAERPSSRRPTPHASAPAARPARPTVPDADGAAAKAAPPVEVPATRAATRAASQTAPSTSRTSEGSRTLQSIFGMRLGGFPWPAVALVVLVLVVLVAAILGRAGGHDRSEGSNLHPHGDGMIFLSVASSHASGDPSNEKDT
ncbi:protein kinase domain-containing protein [Luteimicrobium sp. DT211]|uniref:serine/threonine-protein kinase n=1 Tax=Luteimicrobium sp. DT211 TaxID=3393412 RepID=UPI003CF2EB6E